MSDDIILESLCDQIDQLENRFEHCKYLSMGNGRYLNRFHTPIDRDYYYLRGCYEMCKARKHTVDYPHSEYECKYFGIDADCSIEYFRYREKVRGRIHRKGVDELPFRWNENKKSIRFVKNLMFYTSEKPYDIVTIESIDSLRKYLRNMLTIIVAETVHKKMIIEIRLMKFTWMLTDKIFVSWFPPEIIFKIIDELL